MNDLVHIKKISTRFHHALKSIQDGTVFSSFSKVINILTPMGVFTLQESSVAFSPLSIILEDSRFLGEFGIKPNDKIIVNQTNISCKGITFSFEDASVIDPILHPYTLMHDEIQLLPWYIDTITEKLMEYKDTAGAGGLLDISNHMEIVEGILVFRHMTSENALLNYFQSKVEGYLALSANMATKLASVIGLGFGLTPSCDDFLVGLLSTLAFLEKESPGLEQFREYLIEEIRPRLHATTPVSSAFLDAALSSNFSEMFLNFYLDFTHADEDLRRKNIEQIASLGHSSGIDSLNGMNFGFKLISSILQLNLFIEQHPFF